MVEVIVVLLALFSAGILWALAFNADQDQ